MSDPIPTQRPTLALLSALADDRSIALDEDELAAAHAMHVRYRHELERLRCVRLQYLPPHIEPATALAWIERGGRWP